MRQGNHGGDGMTATTTETPSTGTPSARTVPRLKQRYRDEISAQLREQFGYSNVMQIPGLTKVVVNMGVGEAARDAKLIDGAVRDLTTITGQKPQVTRSRKSIAQFKLRENMAIGCHVTLRNDRMWEFLDRLLALALPRIRDFRGLSPRQFDGHGNYTFGLTEQVMFHEIDQDRIDRFRGMDITVVTTANTDDEGRALLRLLGFPFKEN
jgi:large subunit ribosomal protein L5